MMESALHKLVVTIIGLILIAAVILLSNVCTGLRGVSLVVGLRVVMASPVSDFTLA